MALWNPRAISPTSGAEILPLVSLTSALDSATMAGNADMEHIIVVGDPGTGKSTILTTLCDGRAQFESGIAFGSGLTQSLHSVVCNGKRYSDTPGMDDEIMKKNAAAAIAAAILMGGKVKLVFVLTLESGRVRASNLATVRVVLNALHDKNIATDGHFSVLFNKITDGEHNVWEPHADEVMDMLRQQIGLLSSPDRVLFIREERAIVDSPNARLPDASATRLNEFVSSMKSISVAPGTVIKVNVEELDVVVQRITQQFKQAQQELLEQVTRLVNDYEERLGQASRTQSETDARALRATFEAEMERLRQRYTLGGVAHRVMSRIANVPLPHLHFREKHD